MIVINSCKLSGTYFGLVFVGLTHCTQVTRYLQMLTNSVNYVDMAVG